MEYKVVNGIAIELFDDDGVVAEQVFNTVYDFTPLREKLGRQSLSKRKFGEKAAALYYDSEPDHFDLDSWYLNFSFNEKERFLVKLVFQPFIDVVHGMNRNNYGRLILQFNSDATESQQQQIATFVAGELADAEVKMAA